jgi:hypothetical protein
VPIRERATLEHCDWLFKQVPAPESCADFSGPAKTAAGAPAAARRLMELRHSRHVFPNMS